MNLLNKTIWPNLLLGHFWEVLKEILDICSYWNKLDYKAFINLLQLFIRDQ